MSVSEKDFFTINEILERWRYANVDAATLLKLATDDLLVFSVYIRDLGSHTVTHETADSRVTRSTDIAFSFCNPERARPALQYLSSDDARRLLESRNNEQIKIRRHYSLPSRTKESGLGYLTEAPLFSRDDLLVARSERDKFEASHKLRLRPSWYSRMWAWLGDQANHRVLTMLAGWLVAIVTGTWAVWLWWYQHQPPAIQSAPPNSSLQRTAYGVR